MKKFLIVFAFVLFSFGVARAGGPITNYNATPVAFSGALATPLTVTFGAVLGWSQGTIKGRVTTLDTLTLLSMVCYEKTVSSDTTYAPIPMCDSSTYPTLTCAPRTWTWDPVASGVDFTFTLPLNYSQLRCIFTGTTPGTSVMNARLLVSNQ